MHIVVTCMCMYAIVSCVWTEFACLPWSFCCWWKRFRCVTFQVCFFYLRYIHVYLPRSLSAKVRKRTGRIWKGRLYDYLTYDSDLLLT